MRSRPLSLTLALVLLAAFTLVAATACDSEPPAPVPTPTPVASATATTMPTNTPTPTNTATPTHTPTNTATPTETPQPTFVSLPGPQPTTIVRQDEAVARQQYESELAKWRAQHILEYDLLVRHESTAPFAGIWNLRVTPIGIEMLGYSPIGVITPTTPPARMGGDALRFLTVDGLFASVEFRLNEQFGAALEARVDYVATFDPELGYPISVQILPRRGNDLASSTTIERLIITRRAILTPTPTAAPTDTPTSTPTEMAPATLRVVPVTALPPSPSPRTVVGTVTRSPGPVGSPQPAP